MNKYKLLGAPLTSRELSDKLGISTGMLRYYAKHKGMPHFQSCGKRYFYYLDKVLEWLHQNGLEPQRSDYNG